MHKNFCTIFTDDTCFAGFSTMLSYSRYSANNVQQVKKIKEKKERKKHLYLFKHKFSLRN